MPLIRNTQKILKNSSHLQPKAIELYSFERVQAKNNFKPPILNLNEDLPHSSASRKLGSNNHFFGNFKKNKRTSSVADSQHKRSFNSSINMSNLKKESTYRYMSVTPSHKFHETSKAHDFRISHVKGKDPLSSTQKRSKPKLAVNNLTEPPKYKNSTIEEVKDEYNESKVSFNKPDSNQTELDIDIEAMIIVEDKICSLSNNIANDYYEVTREVYKKINEQIEILAEELQHIKTIKASLLLEYIVVIIISAFSHDSKLHKTTQLQFK